jgi:crotonobetainyl-CoA:carnitine CoA-transferase CaiB-like acyl-CoA transferase
VYSAADIATDPHFAERGSVVSVDHPTLGALRMQGLIAQLSRTPGSIRSPGPALGEHNDDVLRDQLRYPQDVLDELTEAGVIGPTRTPISTNQGRS